MRFIQDGFEGVQALPALARPSSRVDRRGLKLPRMTAIRVEGLNVRAVCFPGGGLLWAAPVPGAAVDVAAARQAKISGILTSPGALADLGYPGWDKAVITGRRKPREGDGPGAAGREPAPGRPCTPCTTRGHDGPSAALRGPGRYQAAYPYHRHARVREARVKLPGPGKGPGPYPPDRNPAGDS
jgi:hypothetical protein